MGADEHLTDSTPTISLEAFWEWLTLHPNCILRAGTQSTVVWDDDDYHWHLGLDPGGSLLIQVLRGKRMVAELVVSAEEVAFVQGGLGEQEGEFVFELVGGDDQGRASTAFFVMTHGFDAPSDGTSGRVH